MKNEMYYNKKICKKKTEWKPFKKQSYAPDGHNNIVSSFPLHTTLGTLLYVKCED